MTRRLLTGLAGLLTLVLGLVGLPIFLIAVHRALGDLMPSLAELPNALLAPGDGGLFLLTVIGIGWASWLVITSSVLVELVSRTRGVRTPQLGPFLPQRSAAWAVTSLTLLATLTPASEGTTPATPTPTATAATANEDSTATPALRSNADQPRTDSQRTTAEPARAATRQTAWDHHRVKRGDTLWDISDRKLGEPTQWPTIAKASQHIRQSDGRRLEDPDLILPGWKLRVPKTDDDPTRGNESEAAKPSSPDQRPDATNQDPAGQRSTPALPTTPLRPSAHTGDEPGRDHGQAALPTTPLKPANPEQHPTLARDQSLVAHTARRGLPAAQPEHLDRPSPPVDLMAAAEGLRLPAWACNPLVPTPFEQAPAATRAQVLTALATQRGHTWPSGP